MAADSEASVNAPLELPALMTRRRAWPPYTAASDATNVPCPFASRTFAVWVSTSYATGRREAITGTRRSAPVSTTAISTCADAVRTADGTLDSPTARSCQPALPDPAAETTATSAAAARSTVRPYDQHGPGASAARPILPERWT